MIKLTIEITAVQDLKLPDVEGVIFSKEAQKEGIGYVVEIKEDYKTPTLSKYQRQISKIFKNREDAFNLDKIAEAKKKYEKVKVEEIAEQLASQIIKDKIMQILKNWKENKISGNWGENGA